MQFLANNPFLLLLLFCCLVPMASFAMGAGAVTVYHRRGRPTITWSKKPGAFDNEEL